MKKSIVIAAVVAALALCAQAKDPVYYQSGRLSQMQSVDCGYTQNSGNTFVGQLIGTDGAHVKNKQLLCQEYTLKTDKVLYHIRPKEEKHPSLLPIGEDAKFRIKKDRLLLSIPEDQIREQEYFVVSMTQISPDAQHVEASKMQVAETK